MVEYRGEFLEATPGVLPSLAFLRALKSELKHDNGTVFRFHNHENTVLLALARQLQENQLTDPVETEELITFIHSLTQNSGTDARVGNRNMVDLHRLNLPPPFEGEDQLSEEHLSDARKIADGGAAMAAYAHLQQIDMQSNERIALVEGLLRYCELDTLAMVMVVEALQDMLRH